MANVISLPGAAVAPVVQPKRRGRYPKKVVGMVAAHNRLERLRHLAAYSEDEPDLSRQIDAVNLGLRAALALLDKIKAEVVNAS